MSRTDRVFLTLRSAVDRARAVMLAASKRARRVRTEDEFPARRIAPRIAAPPVPAAAYSWDLPAIMAARDSQMIGRFGTPARLAESFRTDDALAVAFENRLAPQRMIGVEIVPAKGGRADAIGAEGDALFGPQGVAIAPDTLSGIHGDLANHDLAIGVVNWTAREDGSRLDPELHHWPLEFVWWDSTMQLLVTRVDAATTPPSAVTSYPGAMAGLVLPIVHGDGRWVVFRKHEINPWRSEAAVLPAALVWGRHAFAARDWAKGSASHGNAKVVGTLPEGVSLQSTGEDGVTAWTAEASSFLELLQDVASLDTPVGIKQFGATIDYLTNNSRAWEVWERLMTNAERAAARIYLGTDGTLGATGGAPGVDISALFGVARTRVDGDLTCISRALQTGVIEPWAAVNFGDSSLAPQRAYLIPDADADAAHDSYAKRSSAFWADVQAAKAAGVVCDQAYLDQLADKHGVIVPQLPVSAPTSAGFFAYELDGGIVTIDEVRASKGLPPIANGTGALTVPQAKAVAALEPPASAQPSAAPALKVV